MKSKIVFLYVLGFALSLFALPQKPEVVAGKADVSSSPNSMTIVTSDKAIVNYQKFNIDNHEKVEFIQPSAKSCILNRVIGKDLSQILGEIKANGRVYLVNPQGIYFGKEAIVNTGSFIASTLNIKNEDFLSDTQKFFLEPEAKTSKIVNDGEISAADKGFISLFAPIIENHGSIIAHAGKVILAAGEQIALDFTGDGVKFSVDGELKEALIENYGKIEAAKGSVELNLKVAEAIVKKVVNTDGLVAASDIQEVDGVIRLVSDSFIKANRVEINGNENSKVEVDGQIDASNLTVDKKGGEIRVLGDLVFLKGCNIDASGSVGGGEILIGGGFQGKDPSLHNAKTTIVDKDSRIYCDAIDSGDGGKVIVWADDTTLYDGLIFARGGREQGNGGFVETSGKENLVIEFGNVNTLSPKGGAGNWLLDPSSITIGTSGPATILQCSSPNCVNANARNLSVTTLQAATSNVALCAQNAANSSITVNAAFTMPAGLSIQMTAGSGSAGPINLNANITTRGQAITLNGSVVVGANTTLDTTNAGGSPAGSNISIVGTINGASSFTLNGGTGGTVSMTGAVGGTTALASLSATGATITQSSTAKTTGNLSYTGSSAININGDITTSGEVVTMTGPVNISSPRSIDTTNGGVVATGANINFANTINGATSLTLRAGTVGIVSFAGFVGGTTPLTNLSFTSANRIDIGNNITVTGVNPLTFPSPVNLTGTSVITSNNANINFNSTLNGAQALTIAGGSGTTTFTGAVGGSTALSSLNVTAATITQSLTSKTVGALSYTGSSIINIGGNITTSGGIITMTGPVAITSAPTFDTTNGGVVSTGANINFTSTINGATSLILNSGTGGTVTMSGIIGGSTALTSLSAIGATVTQGSTAKTTGALSYTGSSSININGNITTSGGVVTMTGPVNISSPRIIDTTNGGAASTGANISFSSTSTSINGATSLTLNAGTAGVVSFVGAIGNSSSLTNLSFTNAARIDIGNNITVTGANPLTFPSPVNLTGTSTITSNGANIGFNSTLNGAQALTIAGGSGTTTFTGAVGGANALTSLNVTSATITQSATAKTTGALSYTGSTAINMGGSITTSGGIITMTGPVALTLAPALTFDSTNGGGTSTGANISFSSTLNGSTSLILKAGSAGVVSFAGAVGGATSLTNLSFTSAARIDIGSSVKVTGDNPLIFSSPVNLTGTNIAITSSNINNANMSFSSTLNGTQNLSLTAGTGTIDFNDAIGNLAPLGNITIVSTSSLTTQSSASLSAASFTQNGGTATFNGSISTSGATGLVLTGTSFAFNNTVIAASTGPVTINNSGAVTIAEGANFSVSGDFTQIGDGTVSLSANITKSALGIISFAGPVTLGGPVALNSSGGDITFGNTLNGTQDLSLTAGAGIIRFNGIVGGGTPLGAITVVSAYDVTAVALSASSLTQNNGSHTTTFNGAVSTTGLTGISLSGTNFILNSPISASNNGPISITGSVIYANSTITTTGGGAVTLPVPLLNVKACAPSTVLLRVIDPAPIPLFKITSFVRVIALKKEILALEVFILAPKELPPDPF